MPRDPAAREAREWLARAARELRAARLVLRAGSPLPEIAVYHAQQAAEKALKAYLTARSTPFRHTHDLIELNGQCQAIDPSFAALDAVAHLLTPYATVFRYPGGPLEPPLSDAKAAVRNAATVVRHVRGAL